MATAPMAPRAGATNTAALTSVSATDDVYRKTLGAVITAGLIAAFAAHGDGFLPRVPTIDALAGLTAAAFVVDRLLTFVPPLFAGKEPKQRAADLDVLRFGFGAIIAAVFVALTGLEAVQALTSTDGVDDRVDRVITMLALAGGAKGLARITQALNPPEKETSAEKDAADSTVIAPPSPEVYVVGLGLVLVGLGIAALFAHGDKTGLELLKRDLNEGGTVAAVVRFGVLILAAGVIQQLIEVLLPKELTKEQDRTILTGGVAVLLGVIAARLLDVYLLHSIGFFKATEQETVSAALAASSSMERWGDAFITGIVIAAGTKPIHDLASKLKAVKASATGAGTAT